MLAGSLFMGHCGYWLWGFFFVFHVYCLFVVFDISCRLWLPLREEGAGPEVIKLFSFSTKLSLKFSLLMNMKMPSIIGIFIFLGETFPCLLSYESLAKKNLWWLVIWDLLAGQTLFVTWMLSIAVCYYSFWCHWWWLWLFLYIFTIYVDLFT